jgi:hypothetical protein
VFCRVVGEARRAAEHRALYVRRKLAIGAFAQVAEQDRHQLLELILAAADAGLAEAADGEKALDRADQAAARAGLRRCVQRLLTDRDRFEPVRKEQHAAEHGRITCGRVDRQRLPGSVGAGRSHE